MHIEYLVKMANDIAAFFRAQSGPDAARDIAGHMKRYWDPRMRKQIIAYGATSGEGLVPEAKQAIALLDTPRA